MSSFSTAAMMIQCREKQLPHYFGRLVHALDIFKHAENEGQWNQVRLVLHSWHRICWLFKCSKFILGPLWQTFLSSCSCYFKANLTQFAFCRMYYTTTIYIRNNHMVSWKNHKLQIPLFYVVPKKIRKQKPGPMKINEHFYFFFWVALLLHSLRFPWAPPSKGRLKFCAPEYCHLSPSCSSQER